MKQLSIILVTTALLAVSVAGNPAAAAGASKPAAKAGAPIDASKFDTKLPIEISSDSLEVLQHENKAIFTGNVVAVQGTIRLKSDVMIVHYQQKSAPQNGKPAAAPLPAPAPATGATAPASPMGAITLIEVQGNVFIATPEESAKGETGDYHVDTKLIHLFGDNVILTREKNILRGTALEYNLETGRSLLTTNGKVVNGGTGRVRGVFIPSEDKPGEKRGDKKTDKKQANEKSAAVSPVNQTAPAATSAVAP